MSEEFLSVSELNRYIRDVLSSGFPKAVWLCGEIQGYDRSKDKKHVFFELCEKDPVSHEILARIGLVIFANSRPKLDAILKKSENAFVLKDDIEVKFLCTVDFYPGHGQVRLIVESIDPVYTLGKIAQGRQRLIALLKDKGVLDKNKALVLAAAPLSIGLITSYDSAAYHDFVDELKKSGYAFRVYVVNTIMQGKNAEISVVRAMKTLLNMDGIDVLVITRGGGSIAELSCFDSQLIAEAIAAANLPVLSGIGHEINTTITDLASHTFAKTPTAAAQFLIARLDSCLELLKQKQGQLLELSVRCLAERRGQLKDVAALVQTSTAALLRQQHEILVRLQEGLRRLPSARLRERRSQRLETRQRLIKTIHLRVQKLKDKISNYRKLVDMADPKNTLKRGFSITKSAQGRIIRSLEDTAKSDMITTILPDGHITSEVKVLTSAANEHHV